MPTTDESLNSKKMRVHSKTSVNKKENILVNLLKEPFPLTVNGNGLLSWPRERISCIISGQSEFNLLAKSSTSLINQTLQKYQ